MFDVTQLLTTYALLVVWSDLLKMRRALNVCMTIYLPEMLVKYAAWIHCVYNYAQIVEYYSCASKCLGTSNLNIEYDNVSIEMYHNA